MLFIFLELIFETLLNFFPLSVVYMPYFYERAQLNIEGEDIPLSRQESYWIGFTLQITVLLSILELVLNFYLLFPIWRIFKLASFTTCM